MSRTNENITVTFRPETLLTEAVGKPPVPASETLPEWYRKMPRRLDENVDTQLVEFGNSNGPNATLRKCVPFADAMRSGYVLELWCDVEVWSDNGVPRLSWRTSESAITNHTENQHPGLPSPAPDLSKPDVFKWENMWVVETPPGWSTLFTHPHNRHDLPFRTFSGVVDTDSYELAVKFPFQLIGTITKPFIIEKGTPVAQLLPFKRADFSSAVEEYDEKEALGRKHRYFSKIRTSYRTQHWTPKNVK